MFKTASIVDLDSIEASNRRRANTDEMMETPTDFDPELLHDAEEIVLSSGVSRSLNESFCRKQHFASVSKYSSEGSVVGARSSHDKEASWVSAIASGLVNYLLMFGLCCAYGMIMFDETNAQHRALGVKMNLCTAGVFGFLLAGFCGVKVAIGGPDLNPVVFLGGFVATISKELATQLELEHPLSSRRLVEAGGIWRRLGAAPSSESQVEFCTGVHLKDHLAACQIYHDELKATTIFAVAVSSLILGFVYYISGRFNLTRYASYVPTCVMEAFMSCVGYKVFKYALHFCNYDARQFVPAACVGVPLYFIKAYHIGNPAVVIPLMLFIPLAVFYVSLYGTGHDLEHANTWMFPPMQNVEFWSIWTCSLGSYESVNINAWLATIPELIIMVIVCFLDCLLKILGTEGKLPVKVDKNREMQLFGAGNLLTAACGSSVGYMQLKFNVINFGILGNMNRRGGFMYAGLCMLTFFTTIEHFNYLPRFFLGILLFFAGAGFVAENLWGSRKYLSLVEWGQILLILAVFIIAQDLLYAVIVGVILTCADFILTYAKVPCVVNSPQRGTESSSVRRAPVLTSSLHHILEKWLLVVRLKGFIFFASAQTLVAQLRDMMEEEEKNEVPPYRRLHFVIFDCELMDGMDASTAKVLRKLTHEAEAQSVTILWTHMTPELVVKLRSQELITGDHQAFADLDEAMHGIEDTILEYRESLQQNWIRLHPMFASQQHASSKRSTYEPFKDVFLAENARNGCPWRYCSVKNIKAHTTLLWKPGQMNVGLYLVHSGAVALFRELPDPDDEMSSWPSPVAVYRQGWFLNREGLVSMPTRYYAVAFEDGDIVYWSHEQWRHMHRERPPMASAIQHAVMKQQAWDSEKADPSKVIGHEFLPEEMLLRLNGIRVAEALGALHFYDPPAQDETTVLPEMPTSILEDLKVAFRTFCFVEDNEIHDRDKETYHEVGSMTLMQRAMTSEADAESTGLPEDNLPDNAVMPCERIDEALMYAGIFTAPVGAAAKNPLTLKEFEAVGHEAAMTRFSQARVAELRKIFAKAKGSSGLLDHSKLSDLLSAAFKHHLSHEMLDCLCDEWADSGKKLDETRFIALVSRLVRLHEQDWNLFQGFKDVLSDETALEHGKCTPDRLQARLPDISEAQAREMLWTADWRLAGAGDGKSLDFCDVLCAVLLPSWRAGTKEHTTSPSKAHLVRPAPKRAVSPPLERQGPEPHSGDEPLDWDSISPSDGDGVGTTENQGQQGADEVEKSAAEPKQSCRVRLHLLLEDPTSSKAAQIIWLVMGMLILVSVFTMVLEPLVSPDEELRPPGEQIVWEVVEAFFTMIFTIEYILRLFVANALGTQTVRQFIIQPSNVCDVVAVLPFYIEKAVGGAGGGFRLLRIIRLLRLTRITRIARLAKRHPLFGPIAMVMMVIWFIYLKTAA